MRILLFFLLFSANCSAQGTWTEKMSMTGNSRMGAVGFSVNNKGYVGLGQGSPGSWLNLLQDFWEFNPTTNSWSQKANFPGGERVGAIGFSIGDKGYVGTGVSGNQDVYDDFWEYDPSTNYWVQKANYPGGPRLFSVSFVIDDIGYVGTGDNYNLGELYADFWKYDPSLNLWTQIANFPGLPRTLAAAFSLNGKGLVGTGQDNNFQFYSDMWEYSPTIDTWVQKNNFPGPGRSETESFSLGEHAYLGLGTTFTGSGTVSDFWQYDQSADAWTQIADFGGGLREMVAGFEIACKYYIVSGLINDVDRQNDVWEFSIDSCFSEVDVPEFIDHYSIPNVFTPNGDITNDQWTTNFTEDTEYLDIFNRWGEQIISLNLKNPKWDGTVNGQLCTDGVYFYKGLMRGEKKHGFFHLIR